MAETSLSFCDSDSNGQLISMPCQDEDNQPQPPDNPEETYHLLDLPVETLEKILGHLDSYQEVHRVKVVCRKLCKVATNVLQSAYIHLETGLRHDVGNQRRRTDQILDPPAPRDSPDFDNWKKSLGDARGKLFLISSLQAIFSLAKVTIWSLSSMHSYYDSKLLDLIYKTRNEIIEESTQAMSGWDSVAKCSDVYNENIARFARRFDEVQRPIENQRKAEILSVCTLVDTMMGIEVADWSKLELTRHSRVDHHGRNLATFAVSVSFCVWFPLREDTKEALMEIASKKKVSKLLVILQKFAWNARSQKIVLDYLCPNHQIWTNLQMVTASFLSRLHIPEIRVRGITSRNNSLVTNDCDKMSDTETEWRDMRNCRYSLGVSFSNLAIGHPVMAALYSKIFMNVDVEITCCEDSLPTHLIRKATFVEEI